VISHQKNMVGKTYASIDAVSKPTRKVTPSGQYDPAAARQRYADWKAKQAQPAHHAAPPVAAPRATMPAAPANAPSKSGAAVAAPAADFDPEVGF
jgi:hypothetical protein